MWIVNSWQEQQQIFLQFSDILVLSLLTRHQTGGPIDPPWWLDPTDRVKMLTWLGIYNKLNIETYLR